MAVVAEVTAAALEAEVLVAVSAVVAVAVAVPRQVGKTKNINNILSINTNKHVIFTLLYYNAYIKTEDIIEIFNFKQLLISSFKIKDEISKYYDNDQFKINKQELLRDDISPRFGSGIGDNV